MKCFNCGEDTVVWDNDLSFEDYEIEEEGVVHELHCTNCGAEITYYCKEEDNETNARA